MQLRFAVVSLMLTSAVQAAEPVEYVCPFVEQEPQIDGKLDDPAWALAPEPPVLTETGVSRRPAGNSTTVRVVAGPRALCLGLELRCAQDREPKAEARERDGRTFADDSFEAFVSPGPAEERWYRLCMNAAGSIADSISDAGLSAEERRAWNPEWQHAASSRVGGWTAEVAIPWAAFERGARPPRGHVWRIRIGRIAEGYHNSMWPDNPTGSFHNEAVFAYLVFGDGSVLANGGFEQEPDANGRPPGWTFSYRPEHGKGKIELHSGDSPEGARCIRYEKFDDFEWYPQLHSAAHPVQGGSTYEYSALVNCPVQFVMRWRLIGEDGGKHSTIQLPTDGWERRSVQIEVRPGIEQMTVGMQLSQVKGGLWSDDMRLVRRNDIQVSPVVLPVPHRYHRLEELASRSRFKPYELLRDESGAYDSDRVIFRDSGTGAEIWLMTRSADGKSTRHFYMEASPWNADGSLLCLNTGQVGRGTVLMPADGSSWRKTPEYYSGYQWDRLDPRRLFYRRSRDGGGTELAWVDVATGRSTVLRQFQGSTGLWPMSQDGKYLLIKESIPDASQQYGRTSLIWLVGRDGRDVVRLDPKHQIHQLWFSKRPDHSVEFNYEWARETGRSGAYMMWPDGTLKKVADPHWSHRAHSPDGEWVTASGTARIIRWDGSETRVIGGASTTHNTWRTSPDWWAASSGRYLVRIAADGRDFVQRLGAHNSRLDKSTYWAEAHPQMSADGTKLAYASNMLHDIEFYNLIMQLPGAPRDLRAEARDGAVHLSWQPPEHHSEIAGYLVYRSDGSGEPGEQMTPEPVVARSFAAPLRGRSPGYFTVTAVEHSGLEGVPSAEVCASPKWPGDVCHYFEAERATYAKPANEIFDARASGLYALTLGDPMPAEEAVTVPVGAVRDGEWLLHLRARGRVAGGSIEVAVDGKPLGVCTVGKTDWAWLSVVGEAGEPAKLALSSGQHTVQATASVGGIDLDKLCLTTSAKPPPTGLGGWDATAPVRVPGVAAKAEGRYAIRVSWQAGREPDLHHYNVYCGRPADFEPAQERLIGSPSEPHLVDWGLKAGAEYFYRVTAVDRRGNESLPSAAISAATQPLEPRVFVELGEPWNWKDSDEATFRFAMPTDGEFIVWGKLNSLDGQTGASVEVRLDGERIASRPLNLDYICVGHGGPVLDTWLWSCLRPGLSEPADAMAFAAKAGAHTLTLKRSGKALVEFERFVITNDLGWEPEGTTSFLIKEFE